MTENDYINSILIEAPVSAVFGAIASLDGLRAWWTPRASGSCEVGGDLDFEFDGLSERIVMHVDEATRPTVVRWTCVTHTGHPEWAGTRPTFTITPTGSDECRLDFRHDGLAPVLDCYDQCERGWDHFLTSLANYAEKGRGAPYVAPSEPVEQLSIAADLMTGVVTGVAPDQWDGPTPCPAWNVRELVLHVMEGNRMFASLVSGDDVPAPKTAPSDAKLAQHFRATTDELVAAFRRPDALEQDVALPIGVVPGIVALQVRVTELLVHAWDLARATHQRPAFPEDLAEQELQFSMSKLADIPADRRPFAPAEPVAEDVPAIDRLVACLGRTPPKGCA